MAPQVGLAYDARMALRCAILWVMLAGCGQADPVLVAVSGNAFNFGPDGGRVAGARVTILEMPDRSATTDEEGGFAFADLPAGRDVTFVLDHPDFAPTQTGTFALDEQGLTQVSFQAPTWEMYDLLAELAGVVPDPQRCQLAATVTRVGGSLYGPGGSHGEAGATVTSSPNLSDRFGPIYFNLVTSGLIWPDPALTETTDDGGVVYLNVQPGEYTLSAHKDGVEFADVRLECRPGVLVNASPPWSLQAL